MLVEVREANKSQHSSGHVKQMFHTTNETVFCGEMMQELKFFGKSIIIILLGGNTTLHTNCAAKLRFLRDTVRVLTSIQVKIC